MAPKILLIQLRQLGDILLTTPCIREIKKAWPEAKISFLTHPMGRLVLKDNPYLFEHLIYDPKGSWLQEGSLLRRLRDQQFDIVLDFMYNPRSAIYARVTGAARRLAFPSRRSRLFNELVPRDAGIHYIVEEKFAYLRHLGIDAKDRSLDLPWFPHDALKAEEWFAAQRDWPDSAPRVVLSPTHRREERQWPLDRFARLADRLTREWGAKIIWVWGPGEEEMVKAVQAQARLESDLAPATSFRELAALIAQCDLFIGNSNGPSHVAVAVDTPSLQIHGPTYARTWCPLTATHQAIFLNGKGPEERGLIDLITEEELWQALSSLRPSVDRSVAARGLSGVRRIWKHFES